MKIEHRPLSVAALALFLCLLVAPLAIAAEPVRDHDRSFDVPQRIARTIQKLKKALRGISTLNDVPSPPKP
ncbi:MAG TPA: hypothetical protein VGF28_24310 [Thermoanaerobaculia bacterium]|jgi:hypothetical protein